MLLPTNSATVSVTQGQATVTWSSQFDLREHGIVEGHEFLPGTGPWTNAYRITSVSYENNTAQITPNFAGSTLTNSANWRVRAPSALSVARVIDRVQALIDAVIAFLPSSTGADKNLVLNKTASGDVAAVELRTGDGANLRWHAGAIGNDNWRLRRSADGSAWIDAITVARADGVFTMPAGAYTTQALAEAGANETRPMNALRTRQSTNVAPRIASLRSDASDTGVVSNIHERVVVASNNGRASGPRSCAIAVSNSSATATQTTVIASNDSVANSSRGCVIGSNDSVAGNGSLVISSIFSDASDTATGVMVSRRTKNPATRTMVMGDAGSGDTLTANRKIELAGGTGNIRIAGTLSSEQTFSDYAEYFENLEDGEIPLGSIVARSGRKVRLARDGDRILGVVSATAGVILGDTPFTWQGRYMSDEWGRPVMTDQKNVRWDAIEEGEGDERKVVRRAYDGPIFEAPADIPKDVEYYVERVRAQNPDFDPKIDNTPRSERPKEWTCVGLVGQVRVRVDKSVQEDIFVAPGADGVGTHSDIETSLECMEILEPYKKSRGFAIALCLIR